MASVADGSAEKMPQISGATFWDLVDGYIRTIIYGMRVNSTTLQFTTHENVPPELAVDLASAPSPAIHNEKWRQERLLNPRNYGQQERAAGRILDSELYSPPPSVIAGTASTLPSVTLSDRHYALDDLTVFKVEDILFRFDRTLLEDATIPPGVGSKEDSVELDHRIKAADFGILPDFLKLGNHNASTRHDKKPLTVFDWTSIIRVAVCCILGMHRVQNLACETLSDQRKALLDQQKTLLDQKNAPAKVSCAGAGFERDTYGMYFYIREKGTSNYLITFRCSKSEGVLRRQSSNPWSRPLPEFSFVNSQIRVKFLSDPSLPSCSDDLYPEDSWATKNFVLASRPKKKALHLHPISDFSPWIPVPMAGSFKHETEAEHAKELWVLVEERTEDGGGARTSWEIVAASWTKIYGGECRREGGRTRLK
ncbi:hypothetical protein FIBSPDRAFT_931743 [Athelia psychrophila]|uniref:Uncharacterized protein n=1 Tax=Athelia psychrophila TaxID=1759441 RepID=A0A166JXZ3_9AGAM|nr:hypothetical protein FIBSPDRAFT_931743 [Fibularhizoctonia sp. CBS 109695]